MLASVDVFIPCYNYGRYLECCVASVLAQHGVAVRVLILDDASPDDTPQIGAALARTDRRVAYRRHARNAGHIATYNEGIAWAAADYCLLLSADDYLLPGALARATGLMARRREIGFVFGRARIALPDGEFAERRPLATRPRDGGVLVLTGEAFIGRSGASNIVPTPTAVVRTSLQKRVGGYRPTLPHSGDMEMWLRLAAQGAVGYVDAEQAVYRLHAANMSRDYVAGALPDLAQRKLAIDSFLEGNSHLLASAPRLRRRLHADLAREAIRRASMAFNAGDDRLSTALTELACQYDGAAAHSPAALRLALKRRLGLRAWRVAALLAGRGNALAAMPHATGDGE